MALSIICHKKYEKKIKEKIGTKGKKTNVIIAVGGDGTFLKAIHESLGAKKPVLCVRGGESRGFLSETDLNEIDFVLENLKRKKYKISKFPLLEVRLNDKGFLAFNEIAFFRSGKKAARYDVFKEKNIIYKKVIADGGIISTPAGSTAYSLSCGGPVVLSNSFAFTPINPHGFFKPVVFGNSIKVSNKFSVNLFADGNFIGKTSKMFEIRKSGQKAKLVMLRKMDFFEKWRRISNN